MSARTLRTFTEFLLVSTMFAAAACSSSDDSGGGGDGQNPPGTPPGTPPGSTPPGPDVPNTVPPGPVHDYTCSKEIHVSPTGSDSNNGDAATPLKTIAKAAPLAKSGECVKVHAGTYAETATIGFGGDGTPTAPIVLWSVDGPKKAIIDAVGVRSGPTVLIQNDNVIVDGFEFKNSPLDTEEQVVHFDGKKTGKCQGSVLRNSKLTGGYDHLKINEASKNITVENNEFYGQFQHIPISLTGASGLVFRANFCHDWDTGDNGAVQLKGGSSDVLFDGNRFQDITSAAGALALGDGCDTTCDIDPEHFAAVRVHAINNVMVRVGRGFDIQGCKDCALLSNTIVDSGLDTVLFKLTAAETNGTTHDTVNARILDNIVANAKGDQTGNGIIQINGASGTGLQMDYNLVWNGAKAVAWGDTHPGSADTHSVTLKDPKFTGADDFSLVAGSPAIGVGVNVIADVKTDFAGTARPATAAFDIGAFQSK